MVSRQQEGATPVPITRTGDAELTIEDPASHVRHERRPAPSGAGWLRRILVLGDAVCVSVAIAGVGVLLAALLDWDDGSRVGLGAFDRVAVLTLLSLGLLRAMGMYRAARSAVVTFEAVAIFRVGLGLLAGSVILDQLAGIDARWVQPGLQAGAAVLLLVLWRSTYRGAMRAARRNGRFLRPVTIVGTDAEAARLRRILADHGDSGFRCVGVVGDREAALANGLAAEWAGSLDEAANMIERGESTGAIIVTSALSAVETNRVAREVQDVGGHVHVNSALPSVESRRITTQPIAFEPVLYLEPPTGPSFLYRATKRAMDITLASLGLLLTAPLVLLAAAAIRLSSKGPVFFRQERVGRNGEPFTMLKLRTMVDGAERLADDLVHLNRRQGPLFKIDDDPRITRIGRILRATDLDEVPQLLNVLKGEMSLVGPRPALPHEVEQFGPDLRRRSDVPPGITGLWQVESRDNPSFEAYERLDLLYVDNRSITLDLVILLLTFECKVVQRLSSRRGPSTEEVEVGPVPVADPASAAVS